MVDKKKVFAVLLILSYGVLASYGGKLANKENFDVSKVTNDAQGVASSQEVIDYEEDTVSLGDIKYLLDSKYKCFDDMTKRCKTQEEFTSELKKELMNENTSIGIYYVGEENLKPFLGIEASDYNIKQAKCSYVHINNMMGALFEIVYETLD